MQTRITWFLHAFAFKDLRHAFNECLVVIAVPRFVEMELLIQRDFFHIRQQIHTPAQPFIHTIIVFGSAVGRETIERIMVVVKREPYLSKRHRQRAARSRFLTFRKSLHEFLKRRSDVLEELFRIRHFGEIQLHGFFNRFDRDRLEQFRQSCHQLFAHRRTVAGKLTKSLNLDHLEAPHRNRAQLLSTRVIAHVDIQIQVRFTRPSHIDRCHQANDVLDEGSHRHLL